MVTQGCAMSMNIGPHGTILALLLGLPSCALTAGPAVAIRKTIPGDCRVSQAKRLPPADKAQPLQFESECEKHGALGDDPVAANGPPQLLSYLQQAVKAVNKLIWGASEATYNPTGVFDNGNRNSAVRPIKPTRVVPNVYSMEYQAEMILAARKRTFTPVPTPNPRGSADPPVWRRAGSGHYWGIETIRDNIRRISERLALNHRDPPDPRLVEAIVKNESGGYTQICSNKMACGIAQLIPATAARFGVMDRFDPYQNLEGGMRYMRLLSGMFLHPALIAAAYNAGEGAVLNSLRLTGKIPNYPETLIHVTRVMNDLNWRRRLNGERPIEFASYMPDSWRRQYLPSYRGFI